MPYVPPPIERIPTLPLPYEATRDIPDLPTFDVETQTLLARAETDDKANFMAYLEWAAYAQLRGNGLNLLLSAIDPTTGDSAIHRAVAAGNLNALDAILSGLGRGFGMMPNHTRQFWLLVTHQNLAGDTALHAAARTGSVKATKAVYRLFHREPIFDVDDRLLNDPASWLETAKPEEIGDEVPVEYFDFRTAEDEPEFYLPPLDFVCKKNQAGRDAAEEARSAGHEDLATWLEGLIARHDRNSMRKDTEYMRKARRVALHTHCYLDTHEEKKDFYNSLFAGFS